MGWATKRSHPAQLADAHFLLPGGAAAVAAPVMQESAPEPESPDDSFLPPPAGARALRP
jgi:hypothetical protein